MAGLDAKTTGWEPIFGFIDALCPIEPTFAEQSEQDLRSCKRMAVCPFIKLLMNIEDTYKAHVVPQAKQQRSHMPHLGVCKLLLISKHPTSNQRSQTTCKRAKMRSPVFVAIHMLRSKYSMVKWNEFYLYKCGSKENSSSDI